MLAFLPMWLLGGGGPPREVLSDSMARVSDLLPLWHVTAAIREPWLGTDSGSGHLLVLAGWLAAGLVAVGLLLRRRSDKKLSVDSRHRRRGFTDNCRA
jgi:ABC-2 type transport system permease protein